MRILQAKAQAKTKPKASAKTKPKASAQTQAEKQFQTLENEVKAKHAQFKYEEDLNEKMKSWKEEAAYKKRMDTLRGRNLIIQKIHTSVRQCLYELGKEDLPESDRARALITELKRLLQYPRITPEWKNTVRTHIAQIIAQKSA